MKAMTLKFTKKLVGAANFFQGAHSLSYEGGTLLIFLERQHLPWVSQCYRITSRIATSLPGIVESEKLCDCRVEVEQLIKQVLSNTCGANYKTHSLRVRKEL